MNTICGINEQNVNIPNFAFLIIFDLSSQERQVFLGFLPFLNRKSKEILKGQHIKVHSSLCHGGYSLNSRGSFHDQRTLPRPRGLFHDHEDSSTTTRTLPLPRGLFHGHEDSSTATKTLPRPRSLFVTTKPTYDHEACLRLRDY